MIGSCQLHFQCGVGPHPHALALAATRRFPPAAHAGRRRSFPLYF
jgi:hypothetical protein